MAPGNRTRVSDPQADAPTRGAGRLRGVVLPTGSVRMVAHGPVSLLPGYSAGAWWVQDAAAALPARLLGDVRGKRIADLCAAPGGKTAQLAAMGAQVTAVDRSERRLVRLRQNLTRVGLAAETIAVDATEWQTEPFDGVLMNYINPQTGALWGNFPQTYSMAGLILSAMRLSKSWEERYWHASS